MIQMSICKFIKHVVTCQQSRKLGLKQMKMILLCDFVVWCKYDKTWTIFMHPRPAKLISFKFPHVTGGHVACIIWQKPAQILCYITLNFFIVPVNNSQGTSIKTWYTNNIMVQLNLCLILAWNYSLYLIDLLLYQCVISII